ncbi:hypothetical protein Holit_02679 [Hollandina sp. SP2]
MLIGNDLIDKFVAIIPMELPEGERKSVEAVFKSPESPVLSRIEEEIQAYLA